MISARNAATGSHLAVRFLRRWQNYFAGDVATFPARMAGALVDREIAERVNIKNSAELPEGAVLAMRGPGSPPLRERAEDDIPDF